jgi:hypothetical protein
MIKIKIEVGNDAMQTAEDVAQLLRGVADTLENMPTIDETDFPKFVLRDVNGNVVGKCYSTES